MRGKDGGEDSGDDGQWHNRRCRRMIEAPADRCTRANGNRWRRD
jgi:hypothetical protein